jgi:hypothetical protein
VGINLTGKFQGDGTREYVVMQDDLQRTDRNAWIALVRVMRQRDEEVVSGSVYVSDETFSRLGADDAARSAAVAEALIGWIAVQPGVEHHFQLRTTLDESGAAPAITMLSETYGQTS